MERKHSGWQTGITFRKSLHELCLLAYGGTMKELGNRNALAELCGNPLLQHSNQQRVTAQVEEVVVESDVLRPQQIRPNRCEARLFGGA